MEVKKPFEELYVPETFFVNESETSCCLCPIGLRLQKQLIEHIHQEHQDEGTNKLNTS